MAAHQGGTDVINAGHGISNDRLLNGQAIIELCVCMVAIIVLISAMIQFSSLTKAQTDTMVASRAMAGEQAMSEGPTLPAPEFIYDWNETTYTVQNKAYKVRYGADDTPVPGNSDPLHSMIVEETVSDAAEWSIVEERPNYMYDLHSSDFGPGTLFGMVNGSASTNINLISAFQKLVYSKDSIDIESEVWMTWTKGIY